MFGSSSVIRKKLIGKKGQALVEFALVLPVIIMIASLVIDLANLILIAHRLSAATREGARVATETTVPTPQGTLPPDCTPGSCVGSTTTCCIAVNRTGVVLFNSGIQNANIVGRWVQQAQGGLNYVFLQIEATTNVNFFFGLGNQLLTFSSVGYGDSF